MTIQLRHYQTKMVNDVNTAWNSGARNVLAVLPTGGGKSVVVSQIALDRDMLGANQCVMAHRTELVAQMSMHIANRGIKHRIIAPTSVVRQITNDHRAAFGGKSFVNPDARCTIAAAQTLVARHDSLIEWGKQVHNWTVDECFPAGTLVETPDGPKPIESLELGDVVHCFDEETHAFHARPITHLFKNPKPKNMVRLHYAGHHVIETTCEHPFWTEAGWKPAGSLTESDKVLVNVSMHFLRQGITADERITTVQLPQSRSHLLSGYRLWVQTPGRQQDLEICTPEVRCQSRTDLSCSGLHHVRITSDIEQGLSANPLEKRRSCLLQQRLRQQISLTTVQRNHVPDEQAVRIGAYAKSQSNETERSARQSFTIAQSNQSQTTCSRWKWKADASSRANTLSVVGTAGVRTSVCYQDWSAWSWVSNMLQTGHGSSNFENRSRSGRVVAQLYGAASARSEKRYVFDYQRVESIEIYQPSNSDGPDDGFVFNIEVDEYNTYIANGVVVHNCHHLTRDNLWGKATSLFPNALGLGVTATPERSDGLGLGRHADGIMDALILGPDMRTLMDEGSLTDYEIAIPQSDFQIGDDAITGSGDYGPKKMRDATKQSHLIGDVVAEYSKRAYGKRAICFATDVESSNEIAALFNAAGIPAASVSAKTDSLLRAEYIRRFREGKIWILVNVDLFGEGFDVPACEVVIMARPTASLGLYLQMFGRALRPFPNKTHGLVIDHVSNWKRHGFPDKPRLWTLDRREKRAKREKDPEEIELTACRECSRPYERAFPSCPYCGWEPDLTPAARRSIEQIDGDLLLLDREVLAQMRAATVLESPASVAERVTMAAGPIAGKGAANKAIERHAAQQRLSDTIAQWAAIEREKGRTDQQSYRRFYLTTGVDVLTALTGTRQEMDELSQRVEGWYL